MGKNYRQLDRTPTEHAYRMDRPNNRDRRKTNRIRYRSHLDFKQLVRDFPSVNHRIYRPCYAKWAGHKGKSLKLVSSRRFIDFHQRNWY